MWHFFVLVVIYQKQLVNKFVYYNSVKTIPLGCSAIQRSKHKTGTWEVLGPRLSSGANMVVWTWSNCNKSEKSKSVQVLEKEITLSCKWKRCGTAPAAMSTTCVRSLVLERFKQ